MSARARIRPFNPKDPRPAQNLNNDLRQAVVGHRQWE
jgi:hypothetical protein